MESNKSFLPDDYEGLLEKYTNLKLELDEVKQTLYDSTRQLKINEALLHEYQNEIEILQSGENAEKDKYERMLAQFEENMSILRQNHSETVANLESELQKLQKEKEDLQSQIELLKKQLEVNQKQDTSISIYDEVAAIKNENELLKENLIQLQESYVGAQKQNSHLEEIVAQYQEEITQLKETLKVKREELAENVTLIEKLNDDLFCANRDLENYKNIPLDQASKGNSLFAEVDDRRVYLQKTINDMKSGYVTLKQENSRYIKLISHLKNDNATIRELWKKDNQEIEDDQQSVLVTLQNQVKVLQEIIDRQKQQIEDQLKDSSVNKCSEYQFYQSMINAKCQEISKLEEKLSNRALNEHLLMVDLKQANRTIRQMRMKELERQQELHVEQEIAAIQNDEKPEISVKRQSRRIDVEENHDTRNNLKSCLKKIDQNVVECIDKDVPAQPKQISDLDQAEFDNIENTIIISLDDTTKKEHFKNLNDSIINVPRKENVEDKENVGLNMENSVCVSRKEVKFTSNTVDPVANPARRRGTRVFVMKKRSDSNEADKDSSS